MPHLHAQLSDEAFGAWVSHAQEHGVSVTALVEAIGLYWAEGGIPTEVGKVTVERARRIDHERRLRRRAD